MWISDDFRTIQIHSMFNHFMDIYWLVVWNMNFMTFHTLGIIMVIYVNYEHYEVLILVFPSFCGQLNLVPCFLHVSYAGHGGIPVEVIQQKTPRQFCEEAPHHGLQTLQDPGVDDRCSVAARSRAQSCQVISGWFKRADFGDWKIQLSSLQAMENKHNLTIT